MKLSKFTQVKYSFFLFFLLFILQSCHVYRMPLKITHFSIKHNINIDSTLFEFHQPIARSPLYLTVWTNTNGPIVDTIEYKQIGYTQHRTFIVLPTPGYTITNMSVESEIFIPFGNLLSQKLINTIDSTHSKLLVAWDEKESITLLARKKINKKYVISVDSFFVWENPMNNINYYSVLTIKTIDLIKKNIVSTTTIHKEMKEYEVGGIFSTSGTFLNNMNKSANMFTDEIISDIISNISKE